MAIRHINPASMHRNPAFSQGVLVDAPARLLVVGGQNGVGPDGQVVGEDLHSQTVQALRNVLTVLAEVGAAQKDVIKLTVIMVAGQDVNAGYAASREVWGDHATALTVLQVPALGRPDVLVEIEALAIVPEG